MCRIDDGERCDVWCETEHKARKPHRCTECGRTIETGERYRRIYSRYEGYGGTDRQCAHCMVGADWLRKNCGGFILEQMIEEIEEHAQDYKILLLARYAAGARRQWRLAGSGKMMAVPKPPPQIHIEH